MTVEGGAVHWFVPDPRAILPISGIHVSRSLARRIRRQEFEIRFDTSYEQVMRSCLRPDGNWISEEFIRVYTQLYELGWGHCVEAWQDGELVGGVYGFAIGGFFSAESMFHRRTDAGKVALWALIERCRELGFTLFDVQYWTDHLATLGVFEVSHQDYLRRLHEALSAPTSWGPPLPDKLLALYQGAES
jgi:leucyl/phenylalanyl-tRNA--protein transferase